MNPPQRKPWPKDFDKRFRTKVLYDAYGEWVDRGGRTHLPALIWPDGFATIWCKYCQTIHSHTAESGPRVAHCAQALKNDLTLTAISPYKETGYFIEIVAIVESLSDHPRKPLKLRLHSRSNPEIAPKERFEIFQAHGFRCAYCGRSPMKDGITLELDHIEPKSKGGSNERDNRVPACRDCNIGKGAKEIL